MNDRIILASGSPQRADIMRELGIKFDVVSVDVAEVTLETAAETVTANAKLKAIAAWQKLAGGNLAIAADTVLSIDGHILGKPGSEQRAREYLLSISGHDVTAVSAVASVCGGMDNGWIGIETATARVKTLTEAEVDWYVAHGEPLTRAGAIGISRYGELFITSVHGAYSCFAGLPKRTLLAVIGRMPANVLSGFVPAVGLPPIDDVRVESFAVEQL